MIEKFPLNIDELKDVIKGTIITSFEQAPKNRTLFDGISGYLYSLLTLQKALMKRVSDLEEQAADDGRE